MKKSEWSDKELMELLKEMPKIEDYRHPRDIYQNLPIKRRKKMPWLLPGLATAAALLLFFILIPKLMDGNQFSLDHAKQESTQEAKVAKEDNDSSGTANGDPQKDQATIMKKAELSNEKIAATAIYDDAANGETVLTYWVPDDQAQNLVPVSTIVNNAEGKDWLTLFNENMANLRETEWRLTDYYPLKATLSYDKVGETVIVDVPADHPYAQGSTSEVIFINTLKNLVASNSTAKKLRFKTNGQLGLEAGNNFYEELDVSPVKNHAYFFYYPNGSEVPFLVPSPEPFKDIKSALQAMGASIETHQLHGITLGINDVSSSGQTLTISFNENSSMNNDQQTVWSFEAILLTAKEFGFEKVIVNNPPIDKLGPFDLTQEIKVPIAPNLRETK
ncbi:hypothetical protein [Neobacillus niacini]|uniref:hypothetical protein n=1 Tax=Neobacillus niacini TaxID=86668 RepID=UPI0021CB89AE|nr:hypothetical protein [Neobacillus niacini]MCM3766524.1 hypothetical protein [Neobacillus niacini]